MGFELNTSLTDEYTIGLSVTIPLGVRISVKVATCFGVKVATCRSAATLAVKAWWSGLFESRPGGIFGRLSPF